jgi:hypothetical protein
MDRPTERRLLLFIFEDEAAVPSGDDWLESQIARGAEVEKEHTDDEDEARRIANDHLKESKYYYLVLDVMEPFVKAMIAMDVEEATGVVKQLESALDDLLADAKKTGE